MPPPHVHIIDSVWLCHICWQNYHMYGALVLRMGCCEVMHRHMCNSRAPTCEMLLVCVQLAHHTMRRWLRLSGFHQRQCGIGTFDGWSWMLLWHVGQLDLKHLNVTRTHVNKCECEHAHHRQCVKKNTSTHHRWNPLNIETLNKMRSKSNPDVWIMTMRWTRMVWSLILLLLLLLLSLLILCLCG